MNMCAKDKIDIAGVDVANRHHGELMDVMRELSITQKDTHSILSVMKDMHNVALNGVASGVRMLAYVIFAIPVFFAATWALHNKSIDQWSWTTLGIVLMLPVLGKDVKSVFPILGRIVK